MLAGLFSNILMLSAMAAVLTILILSVKAVFREKLSARWHYYIWLLLVARLVIPYTPEFTVNQEALITAVPEETAVAAHEGTAVQAQINPADGSDAGLTVSEETAPGHGAGKNPAVSDNSANENEGILFDLNSVLPPAVLTAASKIWLFGAILFMAYILIINFIMNRKIVGTSSVSAHNDGIREAVASCKELVGMKKDIPVVYQSHIKMPAICGVLKPRLLIPSDIIERLDADEIRYVILHELCHLKRRDTLTGMLQMLLCILHWFNPMVWWAFNRMREDREPVCDELVLSYIKPGERRNYAETLIKILKCFSENHWVYGTADVSRGSAANMERRLKFMNILKRRSVIPGVVIALITVTLGAAGVLFINRHLSIDLPVSAAEAKPAGVNPIEADPAAAAGDELPTRGKILDRNGRELAVSVPANVIALNPSEIKASGKDAGAVAEALADFLRLEKAEVLKKVTTSGYYTILARKVDVETGGKIRDWMKNNNIKGIIIEEDSKRMYPNKHLASHVIGFTGDDGQGLGGIELAMDENLKLKGTEVSVEGKKTLAGGADVVLTIDAGIQEIVENALDKAIKDYKAVNGAATVVMEPGSGEILAMASRPDYDPNLPYSPPPGADPGAWKGSTQEDVRVLVDTVWRNKALADTFEPGSTFKAITSAMALEEGIVTPGSRVDDFPVTIDKWTINCWRAGRLHGEESFEEALYNSCNPVFAKLSQSLGIDRFYSYVRNFGFYGRTGLELPGEAQSLIHEAPAEIDMAVTSIGQRFRVTPIQLASAYGAIANGGRLMKPQIVRKLTGTEGGNDKAFGPQVVRNVISEETADTMKKLLEGVVSNPKGTAGNAYMDGCRIAGSIGTSEKTSGKYIASFAGFAPADEPEIVCLIMLDEPSGETHMGGATAAPAAGRLMKEILDYLHGS
jgi:stage V sporulation protein D (sporulation-specific penicillin-binding protein)